MRTPLKLLFAAIFLFMLWITTTATLSRGMLEEGAILWPYWWFRATLGDAYCGFITFYAWVAFKEQCWTRKILWFFLVMALGNMAMSIYVLIELFRLGPEDNIQTILTRRNG